MNFFERQDAAKRRSKRLVVLFVLAVLAIIAAVDLVLLFVFGGLGEGKATISALMVATLATLAIIGCASVFRIASLRSGGAAVAHQLGATLVLEDTSDFNLRRLRNVVEEIAIASGVVVPQIFILEQEQAINAFAAGYSPNDAAITITRGALERLNRDELQGVIAHEFSHILNGDMRLNIRLIGLLFGIFVLAIIGKKILASGRSIRSKNGAPMMLVALGLLLVGYIGLFFGRLIKAGISRQREYLADASAVQFTRQSQGLAGALKKLAGLPEGSKIHNSDAEEVSHMLFGDGIGYSSLMATHPPLLQRIQALEPSFKASALQNLSRRWATTPPVGMDEDAALGLIASREILPEAGSQLTIIPSSIVAQVGTLLGEDYAHAGKLKDAIPDVLQRAARHPDEVIALMLGLLHAPAGPVRDQQQLVLKARIDERTAHQAFDYAQRTSDLNPALHLPLAALAFPLLRRRRRPELQQFMDTVCALTHADGEVSLFEYCLGHLLRTQVAESLDPSRAWVPGNKRLAQFSAPVITLLTVVAQAGHENPTVARRAYLAGLAFIFPHLTAPYIPSADPLVTLDAIWPTLDALEPLGKEILLQGLVTTISNDGRVSLAEAELLRAICASLHCPLPPILETHLP